MIPACGKRRNANRAEVTRLGSKRMTVRIDVTAPDDPRGASVVANARWSAWMA